LVLNVAKVTCHNCICLLWHIYHPSLSHPRCSTNCRCHRCNSCVPIPWSVRWISLDSITTPVMVHKNRKTYHVTLIAITADGSTRAQLLVVCIVVWLPKSFKRVSVIARWPRSRRLIRLNRSQSDSRVTPNALALNQGKQGEKRKNDRLHGIVIDL